LATRREQVCGHKTSVKPCVEVKYGQGILTPNIISYEKIRCNN